METEKTKRQFNYPQKFRQAWKSDPKLKDWLREDDQTPNKSYCIYCKCGLISKYCDLVNHATTKKHLKAAVAAQQQQLSESLPVMEDMVNELEEKIEYSTHVEIESLNIKPEKRKPSKKGYKPLQEVAIEYNESVQVDCTDEEDQEFTDILNLADNEFETVTTAELQEKRIKAEIEYFQQKTEYFAKLTENTKIHKTLMILQARKLNLEIKKLQDECI